MEEKGCFGCGCGCFSTLLILGILLILGLCVLVVLALLGYDGVPEIHLRSGVETLTSLIQLF